MCEIESSVYCIELLQSSLLVQRGCVHQILLLLLLGQRDGTWWEDATLLQTLVRSSERILEGNQTLLFAFGNHVHTIGQINHGILIRLEASLRTDRVERWIRIGKEHIHGFKPGVDARLPLLVDRVGHGCDK